MDTLKVEKITLRADGVWEVHTNIKDNLELAKFVDKEKMQHCLTLHPNQLHVYLFPKESINYMYYQQQMVPFTLEEFQEFIKQKAETCLPG